jgi:protocatechuate 3,4-dioxygenase beta subunit
MRFLLPLSAAGLLVVALGSFADARTPPESGRKQAPARDAKVATAGTGAIRGRVIAADTGTPLRRAQLVLSGGELKEPMHAATDAQGRYEFTQLRAGRYTLQAGKSTYVTLHYGQRWAFEAGKPIEVTDGAALEKVDIALPRGGVISGTIVDDFGDPIALACVMAWRSTFDQGKRKLVPAGQYVETNDLGQYRLFGLQPGTYFVKTCRAPRVPLDGDDFAPAYYPGTLNPAEAQPVAVLLGREHGGVDLVQPPVRLAAQVSGVVVDSSGRPFPGAGVQILSASHDGSRIRAGVKADGTFSLDDIVPGEYRVAALQHGSGPADIRRTEYPLSVTADGRTGLVLQMLEGCRLQGRIVIDEGKTPPFPSAGMRVTPVPVRSDLPLTIRDSDESRATAKEDWTFEMNGIGGSFLFRVPTLPAGYMIKSVLLDGRDFADKPLDIKGADDVSGLQIVITRQGTEVAGAPVDGMGRPVVDYGIVVFADDATRWKYPSRFVATARPDQQGRFEITNLPPGRYLAVALEYVEAGQEQDPEYLESLRPLATPFTLSWGDAKMLDLKLTKWAGA